MKINKNILTLWILRVLREFIVIMPILTIFFLSKWLSMAEIFAIQSIFAFWVLVFEVPSWYFADNYWRKKSIVLWLFITTISFSLYPFWESFLYFALVELIMWIGLSFVSWADSALLYDTLKSSKKEDSYHKIESKFFSYSSYSGAIAWILWGIIASIDILYPFYMEALIIFLAFIVSFLLVEEKHSIEIIWEEKRNILKILEHSLHKNKKLKWLIIFSWFFASSTLASVWFSQAHFQNVWVPIALFGIIWSFMMFVRWIFSSFSHSFEKKFSKKYSLLILLFIPFVWYIGLGIFSKYIWSIVFILAFQIAFWLWNPIFKSYINKLSSSHERATILSIQSMFSRLTFAILWPVIWYLFDVFSFKEAFFIIWNMFFIVWFINLFFFLKHKSKS